MGKMRAGLVEQIKSTLDRLWLQIRIVLALSETEFVLRAEKGSFGVWGVLFEPLALMMTLLALRILIRLKSTDLLNPVIWLACGIALLYMFRKIGIKALTRVSKRQKFFFYRRIRPLDTLLASALIEARREAKAAKNYGEADRIREELKQAGIELIDKAGGVTDWIRS